MNKTKTISLSMAALMSFAILAGCNKNPKDSSSSIPASTSIVPTKIDVQSVTVSDGVLSLNKGATHDLEVTVLPENATNKAVTFSSSDNAVVTVDQNGTITAVNDGVAIITVASVDNPSKVAFKTVNVTTAHVAVSDLTVSPATVAIKENESKTLTVEVSPEDATNKAVTFTSTDVNVATVSKEGTILGKQPGKATILVQSVDNPSIMKQVSVTVSSSVVPVTGINLGVPSTISMAPNATLELTPTITPTDATDKSVTWQTSNADVVSVSDGHLEAKTVGQALITCKSVQNPAVTAQVIVNVEVPTIPVQGVSLNKNSLSLNIFESETLVATLDPEHPSNPSVLWSSDNPLVASVNENGEVTALSEGEATIKVKTVEGGFEASATVTVTKVAVTSVTLNLAEISFTAEDIGESFTLTATVLPENATFNDVTFTSTNQDVASVSEAGVVTVNGIGTATITAFADGKSAQCVVTVSKIPVTSVTLNKTQLELTVEGEETLTAAVTPNNATYKEVTWNSTNASVATVSNDGKVHALKAGTAVITASADGVVAQCTVQVFDETEYSYNLPIHKNGSYATSENNKAAKTEFIDEYYNRTQTYKAGIDNPVNLRPIVSIVDGGDNPVDQSLWNFDYKIEVFDQDGGVVPSNEYTIVNAKTCDIKFNNVGKTYKVQITLGHLDEEDKGDPDATVEYIVSTMKGYNVYNAKELSYFDNTTSAYNRRGSGDCEGFDAKWTEFKAANNLKTEYCPEALVLHNNLSITAADLPETMFYTAEEATAGGWSVAERNKSIGSMKDYCYVYARTAEASQDFTLEGNYFKIDWSSLKLNTRPNGETESTLKVDSHSCLFRTHNGNPIFRNVNLIGNSGNAKDDEDAKFAGGLMFAKASDLTSVFTLENALSHQCYITVMSEPNQSTNNRVRVDVNYCKMSNNYNCFLYNWGGDIYATNSYFEGCGGPVVIQDHTGLGSVEEEGKDPEPSLPPYEIGSDYSLTINGNPPYTCFTACVFNNYVLGEEAWFKSFHATPLIPTIKGLGDIGVGQFFSTTFAGKTFVMNQNHQGTTYQEASAKKADTVFNFIVFNKWGGMQALANVAVCGEVEFKDAEGNRTDDFAYLDPQNGYVTPAYAAARTLNANGAPILETAGGYTYIYNYGDEDNPLYAASNLDTVSPGNNTPLTADEAGYFTGANKYMAIYYNGMMLILEVTDYVPGV